MFWSQEIEIKLCQIYTKIHIYAILYKSCSMKQIIFHKYETNLKTTISHRNLWIWGLLLLWSFYFYLAFSKDIINNNITYSPYSLYYVTITLANDRSVYWLRDFRLYHATSVPHSHWRKFLWHNTIFLWK